MISAVKSRMSGPQIAILPPPAEHYAGLIELSAELGLTLWEELRFAGSPARFWPVPRQTLMDPT